MPETLPHRHGLKKVPSPGSDAAGREWLPRRSTIPSAAPAGEELRFVKVPSRLHCNRIVDTVYVCVNHLSASWKKRDLNYTTHTGTHLQNHQVKFTFHLFCRRFKGFLMLLFKIELSKVPLSKVFSLLKLLKIIKGCATLLKREDNGNSNNTDRQHLLSSVSRSRYSPQS